jgi:hypothetical protein
VIMGTLFKIRNRFAAGVGGCVLAGALWASLFEVEPAQAACASVVCLTPNSGQSVLWPGGAARLRTSSTGNFIPLDIWNMGGGNFDIAFTLPLVPTAIPVTAGNALPNAAPINLLNVLNAGNVAQGGAYRGMGGGWSFAAGGSLPNGTLNVTADEVHAGPRYVGIELDRSPPVNTNILKISSYIDISIG